ncbi:MAG: DUF4351 domain-containing protein [Candidatus Contendobacter sp.]|nr:DUF4351 domain-containing protein [Candidatus Contendobacter sp.]
MAEPLDTQQVLRLLRRRFGASLASAHEQRIRRLSLEQTEALMEAFLDFQTPTDLVAWLVAHETPSA